MVGAVLDKARLLSLLKICTTKSLITACTSDLSSGGVEAERSGVQGQPQLCGEFEASVGYMKTWLKNQPNIKQTDKRK